MRVAIVGSRGIPAKYGGYETFAEELATRLITLGLEVDVFCDASDDVMEFYKGVRLRYMTCTKSSNPLKYYHESVRKAEKECDYVLICGAAGAIFIYSKYFRRKVKYLTNMDGIEYKRLKWSLPKRMFVRFCIWAAVYFSDYVIADSASIKKFLLNKYIIREKRIIQIEYGADCVLDADNSYLKEYYLDINSYYLLVSRLEPENNIEMIIKGYIQSKSELPLIVVGKLQKTRYVKKLLTYESGKIIFLGGIYDKEKLKSIRFYSKAYFHGHSVGGTNPSLLEALGAGNFVIAHDNPFNREVTDNLMLYFADPPECAHRIAEFENMSSKMIETIKHAAVSRILNYYNWERIADEYYNFFKREFEKK